MGSSPVYPGGFFYWWLSMIDCATISAIHGSNANGMIASGVGCGTAAASACAAVRKCCCVNWRILACNAPLKSPGKTKTLFTWFGKSERHVAMICAHHAFASSGVISGFGLLIANTIGLSFIFCTSLRSMRFGWLSHRNTSAHWITVWISPCSLFKLYVASLSLNDVIPSALPV